MRNGTPFKTKAGRIRWQIQRALIENPASLPQILDVLGTTFWARTAAYHPSAVDIFGQVPITAVGSTGNGPTTRNS